MESLENQIREAVQKTHDSQQALEELDTINTQRSAHIDELEAQFTAGKAQQAQHNAMFTELKVQIGQAQEIHRSLGQRITALEAQLEQLINKINAQSREKFRVTFEEVRQNFQIVFRKLFGGGKADVFLEDPDDLLDSGIEIIAKPPGKETRSLSLLSGGEKSLTAMSLLFAVFKSKPSPFCFLDEVDAALDEANIERFNLIVKDFQKNSQFVIVTHSKRTMSMADVLFGVTMQTQGVSKKISVKFDHIGDETDAAVA